MIAKMQNNYFSANILQRLLGIGTFITAFIGSFILQFVVLIIVYIIFGTDFNNVSLFIKIFLTSSIVFEVCLFWIMMIFWGKEYFQDVKKLLNIWTIPKIVVYFSTMWILLIASSIMLSFVFPQHVNEVSENQEFINGTLLNGDLYVIMLMIFLIVFHAPFIEEFLYRFILMKKIFASKYAPITIIIPAIIFAGVHVISELFSGDLTLFLYVFFGYFTISIFLSVIYYFEKNIFITMILHSLYNGSVLLLLFVTYFISIYI